MKIGKDTLNAARRLFRLCMDGNTVAEDRVRLIARKIAERKPRNYVALLTAFSRMVEYAVKSRTTQTSLVAQQVRIRQWAEQIRNCQNRPKGMDVETWCTQNNLTKANYYYRLRCVRQICLDQMQDTETTAFVELPAPAPDPKKIDTPKESGTCISAGTLPCRYGKADQTRGV